MKLSTTDSISGKKVSEVLGLVRGNTVRARWFGRDIAAGLKSIVGGEIGSYTKLLTDAREQAIKRMTAEAKKLGADAIIEIRFVTSMVMQSASEILVYGTAVKLK
ncbi:YbjQ family protein [Candidatus Woesearchaeota archaeon]|nr:YbjQ family protein [Candidatus Woesearchaeota archaeon]